QDILFSEDLNTTLFNNENQSANDPQATIHQLLDVINFDNVMLAMSKARFYIQLILSHWYQEDKDASNKPFIIADKFYDDSINLLQKNRLFNYIYAIDNTNNNNELQMNILKQKFMHRHLHKFTDDESSDRSSNKEYSQDNFLSDKKNGSISLQNPKKRYNRERSLDTKHFKASYEN
ncbi:4033_t:CDS:2, partial [Scutellospora calospora]